MLVVYLHPSGEKSKMKTFLFCITILFLFFSLPLTLNSDEKQPVREDFNDLSKWKPFFFRGIDRHSRYTIKKVREGSYLKLESKASASALIFIKPINVYRFPVIRWRWKIEGVHKNGNALKKSGDDFPLRVYIIFTYKASEVPLTVRIKFSAIKLFYGYYPPHSSLNYIWANRAHTKQVLTSPYSARVKLYVLRSGDREKNKWKKEKVNILKDYFKSFGSRPPAQAHIAVMADSDNTGGSLTSYIDYITLTEN